MDSKTILVVGAHMDDCEIGAGGLLLQAVRQGHRVVLVNCASDYSTWCVTKGREAEIKEKVLAKAGAMKMEKRLLGYGYQAIPNDLTTIRKISEIVVDVLPDIVLFHSPRENAPSDHAVVGAVTEYAVRAATTVLGGIRAVYGGEMYRYEVYPCFPFDPDTYLDIGDVVEELVEHIDYFGKEIYAASPYAKGCAEVSAKIKLKPDGGNEIPLSHYGEVKLGLSIHRGAQAGCRFAEAYEAVDKKLLGKRILQQIIKG